MSGNSFLTSQIEKGCWKVEMYSILQMPSGIPVATVAIEGGLNAGLLATQILAINNTELTNKLKIYRSELHDIVIKKDQRLREIGTKTYLEKI